MKRRILIGLLAFICYNTQAQDLETAGDYLSYIGKQQDNISKKYLSYNSAVSHGKRAKKVEKLREKLLNEVQESRMNISSMGKFKGDGSYKDTAVSFMKFYYNILNDDYGKIVNMEEIAEQSYDEMEAYLLLQEEIGKKVEEANRRMSVAQKVFADKNNIRLIDSKDEIGEMMKKVGDVNKYWHQIYLIFFKPNIQEKFLMKAIEKGNINGIEQDKGSLAKYAEEGLLKLQELKPFQGDGSVRNACKQLLQFYQKEANEKTKAITEYFLVKERFEAIKKEYEKKSNHTQQDVDAYNKGIADINKASDAYNNNNNWLNEQRTNLINNWNKAADEFFDEHMPRYK